MKPVPKKNWKRAYIGIDIGGTKSLYALLDENFEVIAEEKLRTIPEKGGLRTFTREMGKAVQALLKVAAKQKRKVTVVGVACAGDIDLKRGIIRHSPNLKFLDKYPLAEKLQKLTDARVFVGHDVQAALYGELTLGAAKKARHVIGVWLGTGVGGALVIDRRLHVGSSGYAGDLGNYLLHAVAQDAPRKEVLDSVASRTAIAAEAASLAARNHATVLRKKVGTDVRDIKAKDIASAIKDGDKPVEKLVKSRAAVVGAALSNLVDFLNPDMIVLGGGLVEAMPDLMRREVRKSIESHATKHAFKALKVAASKLGDHAGTMGAARLALDMQMDDPPMEL
jgi:glucokinase